jgi:phosphate transport system permease protein
VNNISLGLFDSGNSIASVIANEFAEAKDLHMSALLALGLILFVIAFVVLAIARVLTRQVKKA